MWALLLKNRKQDRDWDRGWSLADIKDEIIRCPNLVTICPSWEYTLSNFEIGPQLSLNIYKKIHAVERRLSERRLAERPFIRTVVRAGPHPRPARASLAPPALQFSRTCRDSFARSCTPRRTSGVCFYGVFRTAYAQFEVRLSQTSRSVECV
ncbi:hypothetical protein EVAR_47691_1 [Eumeta japonica]|uniref:Uncharacterized protein n=1 Tax=Eumeta variegata TaxID=151549 RepID=A0A4C1XR51_EUMVA|nr:hypothetical protein EVAR_47691_1 [Eumeta japonica]